MQPDFIFTLAVLILSVVIHEVSHGYIAEMLGDPTARLAGRLTLNPLKHIDPLGSVIIPGLLALSGAKILIGWAKPVPYNPYNLQPRFGVPARALEALVAGSGPGVNILIAAIFGVLIRLQDALPLGDSFVPLASIVVYINILLALFNLIPIPPLDGSKVIAALLPGRFALSYARFTESYERYGLIAAFGFLFLFMFFLWPVFGALIAAVFSFMTGLPPL